MSMNKVMNKVSMHSAKKLPNDFFPFAKGNSGATNSDELAEKINGRTVSLKKNTSSRNINIRNGCKNRLGSANNTEQNDFMYNVVTCDTIGETSSKLSDEFTVPMSISDSPQYMGVDNSTKDMRCNNDLIQNLQLNPNFSN